jgi:hypothetical protein
MASKSLAKLDPGGAVALAEPVRGPKLVERIASRFGVDADKMLDTLKSTAFRQRPAKGDRPAVVVTNEHMMMLLVIAEQFGLNPFVRELYAFPQEGAIVPIIGYDGWLRLMNQHPQHDYCEDHYAPADTSQEDWYHEVEIKRKDRSRPTITRKYLKEYYRDTDPWNNMPRHMIELKATIQCIRKAYGFAGVYDPDEGERIYANAIDVTPRAPAPPSGKPKTETPKARIKQDAPPARDSDRISIDMATTLRDKLKEEGIDVTLFCGHHEIGDVEDLPQDLYPAAQAWIDEQSAHG